MMARQAFVGQTALGAAEALGSGVHRDTYPATVREGEDPGPLAPAAFPSLDGDDEQRMEDLVAARLFPRRAAAQKIGRYTLLDRLGQGGMGVVYAAYDPELDRRVAIKLLGAALAGQAEARLLREAQAMARVVHANVVSVIEVGRHDDQTYVVMEYVRGISLERWPERRPGWRETLRVYVQAGRGLAAAHRAGVIHRDFKPHNAMLVEGGVDDGRVKVLDFGLARAALQEPGPAIALNAGPDGPDALARRLTQTGALMGTPAYMAPEQLSGEPASERSDQFSFAVSLYEALYGQLPFDSSSLPALTLAVLSGTVRPPPAAADVPGWVLRVVLRGLARDPADRHDSMLALCDALERDPAARRRSAGLALTLSAFVGAGGWGLAQLGGAPSSPCSGPGFEVGEVWDETRASAMTAAFTATGLPYAEDAARRLQPLLGGYAGAWSAMRRETCEAHQRGEQSAALLDLRMACLDRRRAGLVALGDLLVRADADVVERGVEAAQSLPALAGCADVAALTAATPLPDDRARADAIHSARTRLAEIDALASAGRFTAATAAAEQTLALAERLDYAPLVAESALTVGTIALEQGRGEAAEQALTRALHQGIAGRADRAAAEALLRRFFVRGVLLGQPERAAADLPLVAAHAARFPDDGALQWLAAINGGAVAHRAQDLVRARDLYHRALAVPAGPTPLELARTRANLGSLEYDARDFEAALTADRAAIAQATAALGAGHPLVGQLVTQEAFALESLGRIEEARSRLESSTGAWSLILRSRLDARRRRFAAAQASAEQALAATDASDVLTLINAETALADALTDPDAAAARYTAALARCQATYGEVHPIHASFLQRAAAGLLRLARPAEALVHLRRALQIGETLADTDLAATAETRRLLSDALLALHQPDEALSSARAAVTLLADLPGDHALDLALATRSLGRALLAHGQATEAATTLQTALSAIETRLDADDPDLAQTRTELAHALLAADKADNTATARDLLAQAHAAYTALGPAYAPEAQAVAHP